MPRDKNTRPCRDCGESQPSYEWCEVCQAYVCDDCNNQHDCIGDSLDPPEPDELDRDTPESCCDDPGCEGCEVDEEPEE